VHTLVFGVVVAVWECTRISFRHVWNFKKCDVKKCLSSKSTNTFFRRKAKQTTNGSLVHPRKIRHKLYVHACMQLVLVFPRWSKRAYFDICSKDLKLQFTNLCRWAGEELKGILKTAIFRRNLGNKRTVTKLGCQIFLVTIYQKGGKYTKWPQIILNGHRLYQIAIKIFQMIIKY
jgi:hypothetical protein